MTGELICTYQSHKDRITALSWSPDGISLASGSEDCMVYAWEALTGVGYWLLQGHQAQVNTVAWSPDGSYLASGGRDETVHLWELAKGRHCWTYRGHEWGINSLAWEPSGNLIAVFQRRHDGPDLGPLPAYPRLHLSRTCQGADQFCRSGGLVPRWGFPRRLPAMMERYMSGK